MTDLHSRLSATGTALQKHCLFFDRDHDGFITMMDTYRGLRAIGLGMILSIIGTIIINLTLAWPTNTSWFPTTTVDIRNIKYSRHGSDSQIYDNEGNFNEERFEAFWQKWDKTNKGYLTWATIWQRIREERDAFDFFGWQATFLEWGLLYYVAAEHGRLSKDDVRGSFDGTVFNRLEERYKQKSNIKKTH